MPTGIKQSVFASLTDDRRRALIALRSRNNGPRLAEMLEATSLAVQPDLRPALTARDFSLTISMANVTGKFAAIAVELNATRHMLSPRRTQRPPGQPVGCCRASGSDTALSNQGTHGL